MNRSRTMATFTILALLTAIFLMMACGGGKEKAVLRADDPNDSDDDAGKYINSADDDSAGDDDATPKLGYNVGNTMPDFSLNDANGNPVSLTDYDGKVVLMDSSAMWCPACVAETPRLETNFYQRYKDQGSGFMVLQLIAQNVNQQTPSNEELLTWIQDYGLTFPVLCDTDWQVGYLVGNGYIPLYWVVDADRVIQAKSNSLNDFPAVIESLL